MTCWRRWTGVSRRSLQRERDRVSMSTATPSSLPAGASLLDFIQDKTRSGKRVFTTSRSAAVTFQRCPRRRYHGYHYGGTGITKTRLAAPLATGGYTHVALAAL